MEYRVYLSNGLVFKGRRGLKEAMRECRGFHRFVVLGVGDDPDAPAVPMAKAVQWGVLAGRVLVVNLNMIQAMVELR